MSTRVYSSAAQNSRVTRLWGSICSAFSRTLGELDTSGITVDHLCPPNLFFFFFFWVAESPGISARFGFWPATCGLGQQPPSHQSRYHDSLIKVLVLACTDRDSVLGHPRERRRDETGEGVDAARAVEGLLGMLEAVPKTPRPGCPAPSCSRAGCYVPACIWSTVGSKAIGDKQAAVAAYEAEAAEAEKTEPTVYNPKMASTLMGGKCVAHLLRGSRFHCRAAVRGYKLLRVLTSRDRFDSQCSAAMTVGGGRPARHVRPARLAGSRPGRCLPCHGRRPQSGGQRAGAARLAACWK